MLIGYRTRKKKRGEKEGAHRQNRNKGKPNAGKNGWDPSPRRERIRSIGRNTNRGDMRKKLMTKVRKEVICVKSRNEKETHEHHFLSIQPEENLIASDGL